MQKTNSFDVIQWNVVNKCGPLTVVDMQLRYHDADTVICRNFYEVYPASPLCRGTYSGCNAQFYIKYMIDNSGYDCIFDPRCDGVNLEYDVTMYKRHGDLFYIDKKTRFAKTYDSFMYGEKEPDFLRAKSNFWADKFVGIVDLKADTANVVAANILARAAELAKNKKWFAPELHQYILSEVAQNKK